jgi:nickel transport protein
MLLDDKEKGPGVAEIFGGIGWLVGVAGIAAYAKSRRSGRGA